MTFNALPSILEIRRLIEAIGNGIDPRKNRRVSLDTDVYQIKMAIKFLFLTASDVAEVSGKYRLIGKPLENAHLTKIDNEDAVIFITQKSRYSNVFIGTCLPLDTSYEPWSQEVYNYVINNPEPFSFNEDVASSKRQLEGAIEEVFLSIKWNDGYYSQFMKNKTIDSKWTDFKSHCLSKARQLDLKLYYNFDQAKRFSFTSVLDENKFIDYDEPARVYQLFRRIGGSYFKSLCKRRYGVYDNI